MKRLFLDIETLPAPEEKHEVLKILHKKSQEKSKKEKKDFEQYLLGTSFDGAFGRILCIGYAIDDEPTDIIYEDGSEKKLLEKFWDIAEDAELFIGHNILDFDMRFIYQRSIINGVRPTQEISFARYKSWPIYDTAKEWVKWAPSSVGLEHLALALGIPTPKKGIDGSQVYSFYQDGRVQEILDYCKRDVDTTREIYKKMTFRELF